MSGHCQARASACEKDTELEDDGFGQHFGCLGEMQMSVEQTVKI